MLASDDANREFSNSSNPDRILQVEFYQRTSPHNFNINFNAEHKLCDGEKDCPHKERLKGKDSLPESVVEDFVKISVPGKPETVIDTPVREDHKARFPEQWERYISHMNASDQVVGTKLADWAELRNNPHMVEHLKAQRFYTVEQVANCSDGQLQSLGMNGNILRQKARASVMKGKESALLDQKDKEIADLKASIAEQVANAVKQAIAQLPAAPPKRKGRPPKVRDGTNAAATGQPGAG